VRQVYPVTEGSASVSDAELASLYAFPPGSAWLRVNMVSSADGAATVSGRSAGLSSDGDRRIFLLLRGLADVVLAGAGTARDENYKPARPHSSWGDVRAGRTATPPVALVSGRLDLDPAAPLFTEAPSDARTLVITSESSPSEARKALSKVADVIVAGESSVDLAAGLAGLRSRGLSKVSCEGGPHLLGDLGAAGLLDELCLTVSPLLAGPGAPRIMAGAPWSGPRRMTPAHVLEEDGFLFCRYTA